MNHSVNNDLKLLRICKSLIEEKLQWAPSDTWKQRDFLNLVNLIEQESGISISLSTIKRLWNVAYDGNPQKSTLDALAIFLGYQNWLSFKTKQETMKSAIRGASSGKKKPASAYQRVLLPLLIGVVILIFLGMLNRPGNSKDKANISVKNVVPAGVPNTVVFNYDLREIVADSFFVQQSWNIHEKVPINPKDTVLTRTYYYPGAHQIKLFADEEIVATTSVKINTDNWVALSRNGSLDVNPIYLEIGNSESEGTMRIDANELIEKGVDASPERILSYYYITEFEHVDLENFKVSFRIKNDSILNKNCPTMWIGVIGSKNAYFAPLTKPGCVGELNFRLGNKYFKGKNHDLSNFGTNIFEWQNIDFERKEEDYFITLNDKSIFSVHGVEDAGEIVGFLISFSGLGSVDYVEMTNTTSGKSVYRETFD